MWDLRALTSTNPWLGVFPVFFPAGDQTEGTNLLLRVKEEKEMRLVITFGIPRLCTY
jgi:hypothetical protein